MTDKPCKCTNVKVYDGHYRCMTCFKEFVVATEEDVMNMTQVAPALARIQELETENTSLTLKLAALKSIVHAMRNPGYERKLSNGMVKNTATGEVSYPLTEDLRDLENER